MDEKVVLLLRLISVETSLDLLLDLVRHIDAFTLNIFCNLLTSAMSIISDNITQTESRSCDDKLCVSVKELIRQLAPITEGLKNEKLTSVIV